LEKIDLKDNSFEISKNNRMPANSNRKPLPTVSPKGPPPSNNKKCVPLYPPRASSTSAPSFLTLKNVIMDADLSSDQKLDLIDKISNLY
jgi:hypothetical protein